MCWERWKKNLLLKAAYRTKFHRVGITNVYRLQNFFEFMQDFRWMSCRLFEKFTAFTASVKQRKKFKKRRGKILKNVQLNSNTLSEIPFVRKPQNIKIFL